MKAFFLAIVIAATLASCSTLDVYEKTTLFPQHEWKSNDKQSFVFTIKDTTAAYNIFLVIRHEDAFRYNNVWVNVTTQAPNEAPTSQPLELILGDNKKGWLGTGMDDLFTHRICITRAPVKLKKGDYHFTLQHTMREDPLQFILNAGIRVEKNAK